MMSYTLGKRTEIDKTEKEVKPKTYGNRSGMGGLQTQSTHPIKVSRGTKDVPHSKSINKFVLSKVCLFQRK